MPPTSSPRSTLVERAPLARMLGLLGLAGLVPAFVLLAPASRFEPVLLVSLLAIALVSHFSTVAIRKSTFLDAEFVAVLLALGFLGPLPGLCVWLAGECAFLALDRRRTEAHLANVCSYGWASVAGSLTLAVLGAEPVTSASGPQAFIALVACGVVMLIVNFAITHGLIVCLVDRRPVVATIAGDLVRPAPATLLMVLLGAVTALLYVEIGILALALFAFLVVVPQAILPVLLRPRPVSEMGHREAVALYARVISRVLELDKSTRLVLEDAARFMRRPHAGSEAAPELSSAGAGHALDLREAILFHREHWDGSGGTPGAVGGEMIPLTSRILAVADAWAGLTANRSPALTHSQALTQLEARAGLHFDPRVVAAVEKVVESERLGLSADTAYAPRLHPVRLPRLQIDLGASLEEAS